MRSDMGARHALRAAGLKTFDYRRRPGRRRHCARSARSAGVADAEVQALVAARSYPRTLHDMSGVESHVPCRRDQKAQADTDTRDVGARDFTRQRVVAADPALVDENQRPGDDSRPEMLAEIGGPDLECGPVAPVAGRSEG